MTEHVVQFLTKVSRRSDLVIAILMIVAIVMMLVPLPTFLVDIIIAANIAVSILIMLVSFYVVHPLDFSSLPSVILVATLFRLAITITTTRLILLQADAGELITAFGTFVVGGSIAVGLVIFLIITVAQFIVVAKGAERVAEVAARFTLDALPGKQMSIDAELRNGDIDQAEARRLRQKLERESQLFGAMDGAMKFVKGDVIAGVLIILVNLIGGFAVGTLQHGMSISEAAATYSLLTVGDGLVAQLPALLVAVAAGTMVTRVAGAEGHGDLGSQISGQMLRDSRALALAAAIMIAFAAVPGFPAIPFIVLGTAFGGGAYLIQRQTANAQQPDQPAVTAQEQQYSLSVPAAGSDISALQPSFRIVARLGTELAQVVTEADFGRHANAIRHEILADLGVDMPKIGFQIDQALAPRRIRIDLEGAPILAADIPDGRVLVESDSTNLDLLDLKSEEGPSEGRRSKTVWVAERHTTALAGAGIGFFPPAETCARWMSRALRIYAGHFVGIQETRRLLSEMEHDYADLVREAQETVSLQKVAEVLRRLVSENVPIRNLRQVLEALAEWGQREPDVGILTDHVRRALRRQISFRCADDNNIIAAYVLQSSAEEVLRACVQTTSSGTFFNPSDDAAQALVMQIERSLAETSPGILPVVLTAADVRRHMRSLLTHNGHDLSVLSYEELAPEVNVQPLATITGGRTSRARDTASRLPAGKIELGTAS